MAASSSLSSSGGHWDYDVFLSFRGEDTRRSFVCHLYKALEQKTIRTFIDSEDLKKGNKISELLLAIEESEISIVVLSENYASSTWCLKELVKILDCRDKKQQIVVPIFYEVNPADIRKLKKKFGRAFAKHEQNPNLDKDEVENWKTALIEIADLNGWHSQNSKDDFELIENFVGDIFEKWIHIRRPPSLAKNLVGMDHRIEEVSLRLRRGVNDVGVVGIWGMGGVGKTTIAKAVFDKIVHEFEHYCFIHKVKEYFAKKEDQAQMRVELLSTLLKGNVNSNNVGIFNEGSDLILQRLGKRKVLIVLDDVETFSQIEAVLGNFYSFGAGSRILVTTRDKQSLNGVFETYELRCLKDKESLELFRKHAFRTCQPSEEFIDLSNRAIEYADGLPLALEVLGASLYGKSKHQWQEMLEKIKKIPERKIMDVLITSFEGLDKSEKDIFLDIACLFTEWHEDLVTELLRSFGFYPGIGLQKLVDRALITISVDNKVYMHDLLREMGRDIVCLQSNEPGKRSRLWGYEDISCLLSQNAVQATDAVECLMLDLSNSKDDLRINTETFVRMTKLRLVIIFYEYHSIFHDTNYFSYSTSYEIICPVNGCKQGSMGDWMFLSHELRFLLWHGCPLNSLPSAFIPRNLVKLDMRGSHIQQLWEGVKPLQNLKVIMLSHCQKLVKIPDLTEAINLQKLFLDGCSSLFEVHSSIFALQNLELLNLKGCKEVKILPSSIHMKSLEILHLSGCSNLEKFPEISDVMTKLKWLYLGGTAIKELPASINNLTGLCVLDLVDCTELQALSTSIHMSSLQTLNLHGCSNLEKFPEISGIMGELPKLRLDGTAVKGLPSSIHLLEGLKELSMQFCESLEFLPDSICNLAKLTHLKLYRCSVLHNLPERLGDLISLQVLDVQDSGIEQLPYSILRLGKLRGDQLSCIGCKEMTSPLSAWPIPSSMEEYCSYSVMRHLDLSDCNLLELSDGIAHLSSLRILKLCRNYLESLPVTMNRLGCLNHLELEACKRLKSIPELSSSINYIGAHNCTALEKVSVPKPPAPAFNRTHYSFKFSNCIQLVQTNLFRGIVETHPHLQDDYQRPLQLKMCLPGCEVPNWFNHQSGGFSVSVQLQPNWFGGVFAGFSICAVCTCQAIIYDAYLLSVACLVTFKGDCSECSFSFDLLDSDLKLDGSFTSDHMFLRYVSWSDFGLIEEGKLVKETYTEATFQIVVGSKFVPDQLCIKSCGVRFVYANPAEMLNLNMAQPQVHVDICKTGFGFMDPYESRNKETARGEMSREIDLSESSSYRPCSFNGNYTDVQNQSIAQPTILVEGLGGRSFPDQLEIRMSEAESSELGEGKGMCQTLMLLPEPRTKRKEEDKIIVVAEQGEDCWVLGSVCRCLSLSGCTVSLRNRNKKRRRQSI